MSQFKKLFEPIKVGQVQLKNRLVMLPVTTNYAINGRMTKRLSDFYVERAKGGVALICFGFVTPVTYRGAHAVGSTLHSDDLIPGLREFTSAIHAQGGKVLAQLCLRHDWRKSEEAPLEAVAPSGGIVTGPAIRPPRELTINEIEQIVEQFAAAARRARKAGFDMVEFHCGLGYLINRFISSATNKRTDRYGGTLEKRLRFLLEILRRSKEEAGSDYTFGCRISAEEFIPGGHTLRESKQVAQYLEEAGVHWLNVQAGWLESPQPLIQSSVPQGAYVYLAEAIKKCVNIPVVAAYRVNSPTLANQIIAEGKADLVGMCRALIADPYLPNKAKDGNPDDIRPCIACCECLDSQYIRGELMGCSVNPWIGREHESYLAKVTKPKRVFVVGGGPAGMQAAIVARQRGHKVTLFEKEDDLGGQLISAGKPPYKEDIVSFKDYLISQVKKEGVKVKSETKATPGRLLKRKTDALIVSTGAEPLIPDVPGIKSNNVVNPIDVLMGRAKVGIRVLVVGGGLIGCETAEFLAKQGKQVTITSRQDKVGHDIGPSTRWVIRKRLQEAGVAMKPRLTLVRITKEGGWFEHNGQRELIPADTLVLAAGMRPCTGVAKALEDKVSALYVVGDCAQVGRIRQAIESGTRAGLEI